MLFQTDKRQEEGYCNRGSNLGTDMKETIGWRADSSIWQENEEVEGVVKRKAFQPCARAFTCERTWSARAVSNSARGAEPKSRQGGGRGRRGWKGGWLRPGRDTSTSLRSVAFILQVVMGKPLKNV